MKIKSLLALLALALVMSGCATKTPESASTSKSDATSTGEEQVLQSTDMKIRSTFKGITTWNTGQKFMNIIGSTHDHKVDGKTWIALYREKCKVDPGTHSITGNICPNNALGGHVVQNGSSQYPGVGDPAYIAPICTAENNVPSLVMTVAANTCVVVLNYWEK
ncbi:hypothetical protein EDF81_0202 [Enterobacter sp. BIGb0383]|uniref:hypothetical protein n=1 Tax=unclassified Enterobacter TaxID=2608935 RepID=UPI000F462A8D|nr:MULTISPECIES: hypothetical protein [unclassified Enterobacter]ROP61728.1 hypothetical protein EDF81_0202 [Enterobacter sp. BIGb0383]ROS11889.1 hypothetical protein EC848_0202 [Enterobacter sp. BIGb0359]